MDDKFSDLLKAFDPSALKKLEGLNITNISKQLEQLKLSGILERLEELNKLNALMKQMEEIKLSELVKRVEEIKLSKIIKDIEENKIPDLIRNIEKLPASLLNKAEEKENALNLAKETVKNVIIENKQDSIPDQIKKLADLKNSGILTEEEFLTKKKQLLERL